MTRLGISLDDGDDRADLDGAAAGADHAGAGDDVVTGGPAADLIFGEAGRGRPSGGGGDDTLLENDAVGNLLDGGAGNDRSPAAPGPTTLLGGPGDDRRSRATRATTSSTGARATTCSTAARAHALASDADRLIGGPGVDLVTYHLRAERVARDR